MQVELTQGKAAIIDSSDASDICRFKWQYDGRYASRWEGRKKIYMHRVLCQGKEVDHINGEKLDNRRDNLRAADRSKNTRNRLNQSNNTSGYRGVSFRKDSNKWRSRASNNGREITIGLFERFEDAVNARKEYIKDNYGGFAHVKNIM